MKNKTYTPLHLHTEIGSIGDSILSVDDAVKRCKEIGIKSLAVTDHGSMACVLKHYNACMENGIKPIMGVEAYVCKNRDNKEDPYSHLILLARNKNGYNNIIKITNDASLNGFYNKPRVNESFVFENAEDIICLSACVGGYIPKKIMQIVNFKNRVYDNFNEYIPLIKSLFECTDKEIFTYKEEYIELTITKLHDNLIDEINNYNDAFNGNFFLEIQPATFEQQIEVNEYMIKLSEETGVSLVVTSDVHYVREEEYLTHDYHVKMKMLSSKKEIPKKLQYKDKTYYILEYSEFFDYMPYIDKEILEEALANTNKIADLIEVYQLYDGKIKMPCPIIPKEYSSAYDYMKDLCINQLNNLIKHGEIDDPSSYISRLNYELDTLKEVNFVDYLLVIKEFIDYAKTNKIPLAPGRGSVAGSLTAYLLSITCVDSIKYGLMFERFISIHRKGSVPDVDLDIGSNFKQQILDYLINKYGEGYVSSVSQFGTRAILAALRDTGRLMGIEKAIIDEVCSLIPKALYEDEEKKTGISLDDLLKIDGEKFNKLREFSLKYEDWFSIAKKICNTIKSFGVHPSGKIISPIKISENIPLIRHDGLSLAAFDLSDCEKAGAIKYDFLSSSTLDIINDTKNDLDIKDIKLTDDFFSDDETWNLIGSRNTITLFQIRSKTYSDRMGRLKPRSIQDLGHCLALVRSPCIISGQDEKYMQILEHKRDIEKIHPIYDEVTSYTNGILLYQEDVMKILYGFGFTLERSFQIMKMAAKKKEKKLAEAKVEFVSLAKKMNTKDEIIERIWKIIYDTGKYSFNSSHAISYAINTYISAWLKVHYPIYWMKNALTNAYIRTEQIEEVVMEAIRLNIKFLPLHYKESSWEFTVEDKSIRIGFCALKGFGLKAYQALKSILNENSDLMIEHILNNDRKKELKKNNIASLIYSNSLSEFGSIKTLHEEFFNYFKADDKYNEKMITLNSQTISVNTSLDDIEMILFRTNLIYTTDIKDIASNNFSLTNHKVGEKFMITAIVISIREVRDKRGGLMAFLKLKLGIGENIDCVIFSNIYEPEYIKVRKPIVMYAEKENNEKIKAISIIHNYKNTVGDPFGDMKDKNLNNIAENKYSNANEYINTEDDYLINPYNISEIDYFG